MQVVQNLTVARLRNLSSHPQTSYFIDACARRFRLTNLPTSLPAAEAPLKYVDAKVEWEFGLEENIELPTVAPAVANKPYRYAYGVHAQKDKNRFISSLINSIIKVDVHDHTVKTWTRENHVPGEPIFVPRPDGVSEDDGVLLTVALNGEKGTSALVVLDAVTMKEVARAEMSIPFPYGFHVRCFYIRFSSDFYIYDFFFREHLIQSDKLRSGSRRRIRMLCKILCISL